MTSTHADQGIDPSYPKPVSRHHDGSKPSNGFSHADSIEKGHSYTTFSHNLTIGPPSDSETNSNGSQIQTAAIGEIPFRRTISGLKPTVLAIVAFIGVASLLAIPLSILSSNFRHLRLGTVLVADFLLWLEVVWLSLACSNLIAKALAMIWSTVVKNTRLKAYKNVDRLQLPILLLAWVTIAWATITRICCDNNVACYETWVRTVERVLLATIAVSATIFLKRLLVYILWVSYASRYFSVKKYPKLSLDRNSEILFFLSSATTDFESKNWRSWLGEMQSDILNAVFEYKSEYGPPEDGPKILSNFGKGDGTAPEFETLSRSIWKRLNCAGRNSVSRSELEEHFRNVQDTYRKWRGKGSHKNVIRRIVEDARDGSIENPALEKLTCDKDISIEELLEVLDKDEDDVITFQEIQNFVTDVGVSLASFFKALNDMEQVVSFIDSILTFVLLFGVGLIYGKSSNY